MTLFLDIYQKEDVQPCWPSASIGLHCYTGYVDWITALAIAMVQRMYQDQISK